MVIESDHKPLETILKKSLSCAPMRLQKMMLLLQRYDVNVINKKGTTLYIADTLSRAYLPEEAQEADTDYEILTVQPVASHKMKELQYETEADPTMVSLKNTILNGWPKCSKDVHPDVKPYFTFRDQLSTRDGVIYKGEKIVVPKSLQPVYLNQIHKGHIGVESSKRAREILYWSKMDKDIEQLVRSCSVCNSCKPHQQRESLKIHNFPTRPWFGSN